MFERQSALGKVSGEVRGWALVQAAGFHSTHAEFREALRAQLEAAVPVEIDQLVWGYRLLRRKNPNWG